MIDLVGYVNGIVDFDCWCIIDFFVYGFYVGWDDCFVFVYECFCGCVCCVGWLCEGCCVCGCGVCIVNVF